MLIISSKKLKKIFGLIGDLYPPLSLMYDSEKGSIFMLPYDTAPFRLLTLLGTMGKAIAVLDFHSLLFKSS
jgi:hypothetical protein